MYTRISLYIYMHIYIYKHMCMYLYMYTHIHLCIHSNTVCEIVRGSVVAAGDAIMAIDEEACHSMSTQVRIW